MGLKDTVPGNELSELPEEPGQAPETDAAKDELHPMKDRPYVEPDHPAGTGDAP